MSINRFDGSDLEILFTRLQGPTALRVYHKQLQPQQRNLCANHTCSQLCLPMTSMRMHFNLITIALDVKRGGLITIFQERTLRIKNPAPISLLPSCACAQTVMNLIRLILTSVINSLWTTITRQIVERGATEASFQR